MVRACRSLAALAAAALLATPAAAQLFNGVTIPRRTATSMVILVEALSTPWSARGIGLVRRPEYEMID